MNAVRLCLDMLSDEPNPGARRLKRDSRAEDPQRSAQTQQQLPLRLTGLMDTLSALTPSRCVWPGSTSPSTSFNTSTQYAPFHLLLTTEYQHLELLKYEKTLEKNKQTLFSLFRQVLTQLKELRLLYLHGNRICKLSEVDKTCSVAGFSTPSLCMATHSDRAGLQVRSRSGRCIIKGAEVFPKMTIQVFLTCMTDFSLCNTKERK